LIKLKMECPLAKDIKKFTHSFKIMGCKRFFNDEGASSIVTFRTQTSRNQLEEYFNRQPHIFDAQFRKVGRDGYVGLIRFLKCPCTRTKLLDNHILSIKADEQSVTFHVVLSNKQEKRTLLNSIEHSGIQYKVEKADTLTGRFLLTARQEKTLNHALSNGYFRYPRQVSVTEMARDFGVSAAAYTETIRKALRKIVLKSLW